MKKISKKSFFYLQWMCMEILKIKCLEAKKIQPSLYGKSKFFQKNYFLLILINLKL